jgi:hypothetical protein
MNSANNKVYSTKAIEVLTDWMDTKLRIPGTSIRFGLDAILSLIPGVGDIVSTGINLGIFGMILTKGVPFGTAIKMMGNIIFDFIISSVPIVGTFFDIGFKSNVKNLNLLQKHLNNNPTRKYYKGIWVVFGLTAVILLLLIMGLFWLLAKGLSSIQLPSIG